MHAGTRSLGNFDGEVALLLQCNFFTNISNSDMVEHNEVVRMVIF